MLGYFTTKWILALLLFFVLPILFMRLLVYKTVEVRRRKR